MSTQAVTPAATLRRNALVICLAAALAAGSGALVATTQSAIVSSNDTALPLWGAQIATPTMAPATTRTNARHNHHNATAASIPFTQRNTRRDGSQRTVAASSTATRPAALIEVSNCNDDGPGSLRFAALNAVSGDVIDLHLLTCSTITLTSGAIVLNQDEVTLLGPGQDKLTIDGNHAGGVLYVYGVNVTDLTIANGSMQYGGCINTYGDLTLTRTTVTGCQAGDGIGLIAEGGGAFVYGGDLTMSQSTISHSTALGAEGATGGGASVRGNAHLTDSTIDSNRAQGVEAGGGGLMVNGVLYLNDSRVTGNAIQSSAGAAYGGGIFTHGGVGATRSTISGNSAQADSGAAMGGGLNANDGAYLIDSHVTHNSVRSTADVAYGGGIHTSNGVAIETSTISGNSAHSDTRWSYGGGIHTQGTIAMADSTLSNNTASSECGTCYILGGGALAFGVTQVANSTISGNTVQLLGESAGYAFGGGMAITGSYAAAIALYNTTVSGNAAIGANGTGMGGGVHSGYSPFGLFNSTVASNSASTRGGGAAGGDNGGLAPMLSSAIVAMNQAPTDADLASVTGPLTVDGDHSLVMSADSNMTLPLGTLTINPRLLPLANNGGPTATHALAACSPAIDTGVMNPWRDLDFDQRGAPFVRTYGSAVDMGAFELQPDVDRIFYDGFEVSPCP